MHGETAQSAYKIYSVQTKHQLTFIFHTNCAFPS